MIVLSENWTGNDRMITLCTVCMERYMYVYVAKFMTILKVGENALSQKQKGRQE